MPNNILLFPPGAFGGGGPVPPDIYAATLVVNGTGANANFTTLEAALAAMPVAGGKIFVREGVYTAPAGGYAMPDSNIEIICAGRGATLFMRVGAGPVFSFGFDRNYRFSGFTVLGDHGVTAQTAFVRTGAASVRRIKIENVNVGATLAAANGTSTILDSGGFQTNWDVTDCDFLMPIFPVDAALLRASATDAVSMSGVRTAGRARIIGSPILTAYNLNIPLAIVTTQTYGVGSRIANSVIFAISGHTFGDDCEVVNSLIVGGPVVGARFKAANSRFTTVITAAGDRAELANCGLVGFSSTGFNDHAITGCVPGSGGTTISVMLTDSLRCTVTGDTGLVLVEAGTSDRNVFADNVYDAASPPVVVGPATLFENWNTRTVVAGLTLDETHRTVLVNAVGGAIIVALPAAALARYRRYTIKKVDASAFVVTIDASGAELIDGALTIGLTVQYQSVEIQSDGTSWSIV